MNKLNTRALALLIGSIFAINAAQAEDKAAAGSQSTIVDALLEQGFVAVKDGLYSNTTASGKALVATNPAGQQALASQIQVERDIFAQRAQKSGISANEQRILDRMQANIDNLRKAALAQAKNSQSNYGSCLTPNGAGLYASATSSAGTSASSTAVNALDFSPVTPTDNYAEAATEYTFSSNSNVGYTPANASTSHPRSCFAYGYSHVICPGESSPGVSAYASSTSNAPRCYL